MSKKTYYDKWGRRCANALVFSIGALVAMLLTMGFGWQPPEAFDVNSLVSGLMLTIIASAIATVLFAVASLGSE